MDIFKLGLVAGAALLVSGCNPSTLASIVPVDVNGDGSISAGERALTGYTRTYAAPGGPANVTAAQVAGLQGLAAGTSVGTSAANNTGTIKNATIKLAEDKQSMSVTVDGQTFTLASNPQHGSTTIGGKTYEVYSFTSTQDPPGNVVGVLNQQYSSVSVFAKEVTANGMDNNGFIVVATGLETPDAGLPKAIVNYGGAWGIVTHASLGTQGSSGAFEARADFNSKQLSATLRDSNNSVAGTVSAKINGSQFAGSTNIASATASGSGEVVGAFDGPNAEEIGGVASGSASFNGQPSEAYSGFFLGSKTP